MWLDRHFLPSFLIARVWYVRIETSMRLIFAACGLALVLAARPVASRMTRRTLRRVTQITFAIILALAAGEVVMQRVRLRPQSRGAAALIVVPQPGPEDEAQARLRRQIVDEERLPYVLVQIDPTWHIAWDRHPDARGAQLIASTITMWLHGANISGHS